MKMTESADGYEDDWLNRVRFEKNAADIQGHLRERLELAGCEPMNPSLGQKPDPHVMTTDSWFLFLFYRGSFCRQHENKL
jgi:hypothetical protein